MKSTARDRLVAGGAVVTVIWTRGGEMSKIRIEDQNGKTCDIKLRAGVSEESARETARTLLSVGARSARVFLEGRRSFFV